MTAHRVLLGGVLLAALVAAVAATLWLRKGGASVTPPRPGDETEALVTLVDAAREHLRALRGILAAAVVFLAVTGLVLLTFFFLYLEDLVAPPSPDWHAMIRIGFSAVWLTLLAAGLVVFARVHRTLRRWDRRARDGPLGL